MEILGYALAIFMGVVLGLIGGGGSILSVPILVYILGVAPVEATAYSLFIVGLSSVIASFDYHRRGLLDFKTGAIFAVPAFVGVYSVRKFLVPILPENIFTISNWTMTKDSLILVVFSVVMLLAALSMILGRKEDAKQEKKEPAYWIVLVEGLVVGSITGFVGAGGGFMIIPALVVLAGLEMKVAIGTSLFIISVKSLIGFLGDVQTLPNIDWTLLFLFSGLSIAGILIGAKVSRKVKSASLKPAFGWFVMVMGIAILLKETVF